MKKATPECSIDVAVDEKWALVDFYLPKCECPIVENTRGVSHGIRAHASFDSLPKLKVGNDGT